MHSSIGTARGLTCSIAKSERPRNDGGVVSRRDEPNYTTALVTAMNVLECEKPEIHAVEKIGSFQGGFFHPDPRVNGAKSMLMFRLNRLVVRWRRRLWRTGRAG